MKRILRYIRRFRHRCGYGIHSPFAFDFVTSVIYERSPYYAYSVLCIHYRGSLSPLRYKDCMLLFRLSNYQRPRHCLVFAHSTYFLRECLWAGSRHTRYHKVYLASHPSHLSTPDVIGIPLSAAPTVDMAVVPARSPLPISHIINKLNEGAMLVVLHPHADAQSRETWQQILRSPQLTVTFDLYDMGIAFKRSDLHTHNYIINYY